MFYNWHFTAEIKTTQYGEMDVRAAPAYLEYGSALFLRAQDASDTFESDGTCANAEDKAQGSAVEQAKSAAGGLPEQGSPLVLDAEDIESDLELSWEMLELARLLYSEETGIHNFELSRVHVKLGNHSLHRKDFRGAVEELQKALQLRQKNLPRNSRFTADVHADLAAAFTDYADLATINPQDRQHALEESAEHCMTASSIVNTLFEEQSSSSAGSSGGSEAASGTGSGARARAGGPNSGKSWAPGSSGSSLTVQSTLSPEERELQALRATALLIEHTKSRMVAQRERGLLGHGRPQNAASTSASVQGGAASKPETATSLGGGQGQNQEQGSLAGGSGKRKSDLISK